MATFEDAAEDLVVKLRGLDSEIEESEQLLGDLRQRVETVEEEVEREWAVFDASLSAFVEMVREQVDQLHREGEETLRGLSEAQDAVVGDGGEARAGIGEGRAHVEALGEHAAGLTPGVESLVAEGGEAPARSLTERARELEQELERTVEEARDFLRDEVVPAVEDMAADVTEACQALRTALEEEIVSGLETAFADWESKATELEEYVSSQSFGASHAHAQAVVEWALEQCRSACQEHLAGLDGVYQAAIGPLRTLAWNVQESSESLAEGARELVLELDGTADAARNALRALGSVRDLLAAYSFVAA